MSDEKEPVDVFMTVEQAQAAVEAVPRDTLRRKLAMGDLHIAHARVTFGDDSSEVQTIISDLVGDLMHVCEREGISFADVYDTALDHYQAERDELPK